jgi:hypothetical protein
VLDRGGQSFDSLGRRCGHLRPPSARRAAGVWPDQRRKARVNTLAAEQPSAAAVDRAAPRCSPATGGRSRTGSRWQSRVAPCHCPSGDVSVRRCMVSSSAMSSAEQRDLVLCLRSSRRRSSENSAHWLFFIHWPHSFSRARITEWAPAIRITRSRTGKTRMVLPWLKRTGTRTWRRYGSWSKGAVRGSSASVGIHGGPAQGAQGVDRDREGSIRDLIGALGLGMGRSRR